MKWILRYERALKSDFCGPLFVQPSRTATTEFLEWSEISQRAVRSSFY